ncbi:hypothetical protein EW146_g1066 [Bondarzewia mesenterica]|uniref:Uncharacterized protein n=1 Tax=Bondarzewia mesenterica TaxID=1095465 RepID=A0A4S4M5G8_9AGAM|nr:hypothetical protein EW146_g1066 [Bondarzewia mesenterica]
MTTAPSSPHRDSCYVEAIEIPTYAAIRRRPLVVFIELGTSSPPHPPFESAFSHVQTVVINISESRRSSAAYTVLFWARDLFREEGLTFFVVAELDRGTHPSCISASNKANAYALPKKIQQELRSTPEPAVAIPPRLSWLSQLFGLSSGEYASVALDLAGLQLYHRVIEDVSSGYDNKDTLPLAPRRPRLTMPERIP